MQIKAPPESHCKIVKEYRYKMRFTKWRAEMFKEEFPMEVL